MLAFCFLPRRIQCIYVHTLRLSGISYWYCICRIDEMKLPVARGDTVSSYTRFLIRFNRHILYILIYFRWMNKSLNRCCTLKMTRFVWYDMLCVLCDILKALNSNSIMNIKFPLKYSSLFKINNFNICTNIWNASQFAYLSLPLRHWLMFEPRYLYRRPDKNFYVEKWNNRIGLDL